MTCSLANESAGQEASTIGEAGKWFPLGDPLWLLILSSKPVADLHDPSPGVTVGSGLYARGELAGQTQFAERLLAKHPQQEYIQLDTTNILFVCGGSFDGLEDIIKNRIGKTQFGFCSSRDQNNDEAGELLRLVEQHDLQTFGLIPELVGRLPVVTVLDDLDVDDLVCILRDPENALLKQYRKLLLYDDVRLAFTDDACQAIAELAKGTGARALRSVVEEALAPLMFELSELGGRQVIIDADVVLGQKVPVPVERIVPASTLKQPALLKRLQAAREAGRA